MDERPVGVDAPVVGAVRGVGEDKSGAPIELPQRLKIEDGTVFKPNDRYPLTKEVFRLYYTSASIDQQTIDVYVEDNFGQMVKLSFEFNSQKDEEKEKKDEDRK